MTGEVDNHHDWAVASTTSGARQVLEVAANEVGFHLPSPSDPTLWPSDHAGLWADLVFTASRRDAD